MSLAENKNQILSFVNRYLKNRDSRVQWFKGSRVKKVKIEKLIPKT